MKYDNILKYALFFNMLARGGGNWIALKQYSIYKGIIFILTVIMWAFFEYTYKEAFVQKMFFYIFLRC